MIDCWRGETSEGAHDWWKGYGVDTTHGVGLDRRSCKQIQIADTAQNALFLNTTTNEKHDVMFNFIARRNGVDNIMLILIGPYLESETLRCGVLIQ